MTEKSWIWNGSAQADPEDARRELEDIKRREHEQLQARLGYRVVAPQGREATGVSRHEMQELLQRGGLQRDEKDTTVKRSGLGRTNTASFGGTAFAASEILEGTALPPPPPQPQYFARPATAHVDAGGPSAADAGKKQHKVQCDVRVPGECDCY